MINYIYVKNPLLEDDSFSTSIHDNKDSYIDFNYLNVKQEQIFFINEENEDFIQAFNKILTSTRVAIDSEFLTSTELNP